MPLLYFFSLAFLLTVAAFFVFFTIFKKWKGNKMILSIGLFWLSVSFTWFATFLANVFLVFDLFFLSKVNAYLSLTFAIFGSPFLIYYLIMKSLNREKLARFFFVIYCLWTFVFLYFLFTNRLLAPISLEAGVKYGLTPFVFKIFGSFYIPLVFFLLYDFFKRIIGWIRAKRLKDGYLLLSTISVIVYMSGGFFEAGRLVTGWGLTFTKITLLSSILMAYLAYSRGSYKGQKNIWEI